MLKFNPFHWYWRKQDGMLYSSSKQREVAQDDSDFLKWSKAGGVPYEYPRDSGGNDSRELMLDTIYPYRLRIYPLTLEEEMWDREIARIGSHNPYAWDEHREVLLSKYRKLIISN